ncbi:MAG: hypothetical protein P4L56_26825 [Candidatus Sulfopaludibacter sp.]|nr:hypothetical protein [Candidatus Sulfopaludibacter sp.]
MMNHDPFQSYQTGAYPGGATPYGLPYTAHQQFINPGAFGGYGMNPQHQQGGFGGGQNPLFQNQQLQNPLFQNPLLQQALLQNQLQQLAWQNQMLNPMLANQGWPQQQQQFGGYPLAPQGQIGGGGAGQIGGFGQLHPLVQLALRQASGYGISPYGGSF